MHKTLLGYMDLFVHSQDPQLSPRTLVTKKNYLSLFLNYLDSSGIYDLRDFDINAVYSFIDSLDYASQTISGIQFTIREFFDILFGNNCTSIYGRKIFPIIFTNKRDRILSYYEPDEVRSLVNAIDINTQNGVCDKCMILLAAQTGLRSGDIINLRFGEILWDKHLIFKTQKKLNYLSLFRFLKTSPCSLLIISRTTGLNLTNRMYSYVEIPEISTAIRCFSPFLTSTL